MSEHLDFPSAVEAALAGGSPERVAAALGRLADAFPPEGILDDVFRQADLDWLGVVAYDRATDLAVLPDGGGFRTADYDTCVRESYAERLACWDEPEHIADDLAVYLDCGGDLSRLEIPDVEIDVTAGTLTVVEGDYAGSRATVTGSGIDLVRVEAEDAGLEADDVDGPATDEPKREAVPL